MAAPAELNALHRMLEELRSNIVALSTRYGDIPAIRRLLGDVERIDLDAHELDEIAAPEPTKPALQMVDDTPIDPALFADADDEGLGGYQGRRTR